MSQGTSFIEHSLHWSRLPVAFTPPCQLVTATT